MPTARCCHCGFSAPAHFQRAYYEKEGTAPQTGFNCTLAQCPGFQDMNARLNAENEARRRMGQL